MSSTRSATGCLACKTKRKKCDETKPHCLRCQKSRIECPGYTYLQDSNKPNRRPRTIPAPRSVGGQPRATTQEGASLENTEEAHSQKQDHLPIDYYLVTSGASSSAFGTSVVGGSRAPSEDIDISNRRASLFSFTGSLQLNSTTSHRLATNTPDSCTILPSPGIVAATPLTSGQASLLEALFSLGQPSDQDPPSLCAKPTTDFASHASVPSISNWPPPEVDQRDGVASYEDDDPEGLGVSVLCRQPILDRTVESNALPFTLQGYATWISRMAFEPAKLTHIARQFVFSHFEDGNQQSRWIIALLANVGSRIGGAEGSPNRMLSVLQDAVRQRLGVIKSYPNPETRELVGALDSALETMVIHFSISPFSEAMVLQEEAAPIFRQLCPDTPGAPINLSSLLHHPLGCLRHYVEIDVIFSVITDMSMSFRYEVSIPGSQPFDSNRSTSINQDDGVVQWLHGVPNEIILLFARMKTLRQDGSKPNDQTIALIERDIHELQPFDGSLTERFVTIMRSVVQECWRQAAYIYLYMVSHFPTVPCGYRNAQQAVRGDSCDTPRVKGAYKRFMRLLKGTKPGRLPDEFLIAPLLIIAPVAQRQHDREIIRQRALGLQRFGQTFRANVHIICIVEDYWARTDAEGRQVVWSDVAVSRRRVLGV